MLIRGKKIGATKYQFYEYYDVHNEKTLSAFVDTLLNQLNLQDTVFIDFMLNKKVSWEEKRDWLIKVKQSEKAFTSLHNLISKYYLYQVNRELTDIKQIYGS